jgi:hypothetical protein
VSKKHVLCLALLGGLALALALLLALEAPGKAAPVQSIYLPHSSVPVGEAAIQVHPSLMGQAQLSLSEPDLSASCRYGVTAGSGQLLGFDIVSNLGAGVYMDFSTHHNPQGPPEVEYLQMVRLHQGRALRNGTDICGPDYGFTVTHALTDAEYGLGWYVDAQPGSLWIVGNEPDRRNAQDDICPQQYAVAYHDVYHFIKERDSSAQVAFAGLVEVTPARLQYLDIVWETYLEKYGTTMPVDVWTFHIYVLSESDDGDAHIALGTDPNLRIPHSHICSDPDTICQAEHDDIDLFIEQVLMMRQWMKSRGQQNKPLLLTEFGILKPYNYYGICPGVEWCIPEDPPTCFCDENKQTFHPERVADFLEDTFDYLMTASSPTLGYPDDGYRLVQQWLWYRLATKHPEELAHASNVVTIDQPYDFTAVGQRWHDYAASVQETMNFYPSEVPGIVAHIPPGEDAVTVTLSVAIKNNGDLAPTETVTVTFYSDEGLTIPIGSATFTGLRGCARFVTVAATMWKDLGAGAHPFWVKIDSEETVAETLETDNVAQGLVLVNPRQLFLPLVLHKK